MHKPRLLALLIRLIEPLFMRIITSSEVKESAKAKSIGAQDERDFAAPDRAFLDLVLASKKKIPKSQANYSLSGGGERCCVKCKFNLGDEQKCHVVDGTVDNSHGISQFFSARGEGMLPGDLVWIHVNRTG